MINVGDKIRKISTINCSIGTINDRVEPMDGVCFGIDVSNVEIYSRNFREK